MEVKGHFIYIYEQIQIKTWKVYYAKMQRDTRQFGKDSEGEIV